MIDASVVAASVFAEPAQTQAEAQMLGYALCAPSIIDYELANVALNKLRSKLLATDDVQRALNAFDELEIERWDIEPGRVIRIGEAFGLTAYDAAYLWVAGHLRVPIATFDSRVAAAAAHYLKELPPSPSPES